MHDVAESNGMNVPRGHGVQARGESCPLTEKVPGRQLLKHAFEPYLNACWPGAHGWHPEAAEPSELKKPGLQYRLQFSPNFVRPLSVVKQSTSGSNASKFDAVHLNELSAAIARVPVPRGHSIQAARPGWSEYM